MCDAQERRTSDWKSVWMPSSKADSTLEPSGTRSSAGPASLMRDWGLVLAGTLLVGLRGGRPAGLVGCEEEMRSYLLSLLGLPGTSSAAAAVASGRTGALCSHLPHCDKTLLRVCLICWPATSSNIQLCLQSSSSWHASTVCLTSQPWQSSLVRLRAMQAPKFSGLVWRHILQGVVSTALQATCRLDGRTWL